MSDRTPTHAELVEMALEGIRKRADASWSEDQPYSYGNQDRRWLLSYLDEAEERIKWYAEQLRLTNEHERHLEQEHGRVERQLDEAKTLLLEVLTDHRMSGYDMLRPNTEDRVRHFLGGNPRRGC